MDAVVFFVLDICQKRTIIFYINGICHKQEDAALPRPRKCRKVCCLPKTPGFLPINGDPQSPAVILTVDEYETLRLIDKQGFSQEECGAYMKVARTTIQQIYTSARKKIAVALVDVRPIKIEGGDYQLCDGNETYCDCGGCRKHRRRCFDEEQEAIYEDCSSDR